MKNKRTILIIDGNNLAYRIFSKFSESGRGLLTNSVGQPTTLIFGFLRMLDTFTKNKSVDSMIVCWDVKGGSKYRKSIYSNYKGNREYKDMADYFIELEACRNYMEMLGINQAPMKGIEADDIVGYTAKVLCKKHKVIVMSDDKDYYQLLEPNIKLFRPCIKQFFTYRELLDNYYDWKGFKPIYLAKIVGFIGQGKDNIPGPLDFNEETGKFIKIRLGESAIKKLLPLARWKIHLAKKWLKYDSPLNEKHTEHILRNWDNVKTSIHLMRIRTRPSDYEEEELAKLNKICKRASKQQQVSSTIVNKLMRDLEIARVKAIPVLQKIGIEVIGHSGKLSRNRFKRKS